jgi:hypothetical protein
MYNVKTRNAHRILVATSLWNIPLMDLIMKTVICSETVEKTREIEKIVNLVKFGAEQNYSFVFETFL